MILMIDNYDSFTFNLVQYLRGMGAEVLVKRNDELTVEQALALNAQGIVISPGPCSPSEAGISVALVQALNGRVPLLGICLGLQSIGQAYGGKIVHAKRIMHGKVSDITHDGKGFFAGVKSPLKATRYHSLAIERETIPECLTITATSEDGEIMGARHTSLPVEGVQFHPESVLTTSGKRLMKNFLKQVDPSVHESAD